MSFELQNILENKRSLRRNLAAKSVAEKMRILDALREREVVIRWRVELSDSSVRDKDPSPYDANSK